MFWVSILGSPIFGNYPILSNTWLQARRPPLVQTNYWVSFHAELLQKEIKIFLHSQAPTKQKPCRSCLHHILFLKVLLSNVQVTCSDQCSSTSMQSPLSR